MKTIMAPVESNQAQSDAAGPGWGALPTAPPAVLAPRLRPTWGFGMAEVSGGDTGQSLFQSTETFRGTPGLQSHGAPGDASSRVTVTPGERPVAGAPCKSVRDPRGAAVGNKTPSVCRSLLLHTYRSNPYGGHKSPLITAPSIEMPFMER